MRKRILSLALITAVIMSIFCMPQTSAEEWTDVHESNFRVLMGLKIVNTREEGDYAVFRELSKSAFVNFICNIYDDYGYTEAYNEEAVAFAEQAGIIHSGQTDLTKPLYYDEAMTMLVRALGYGIHAEESGGFPYGYNAIAQKLGLADGVVAKSGERLREYDAITLLYNAISCNYVEIAKITADGIVYGNTSDKTFLHEMRKVYKVEGIIDGTEVTSIVPELKVAEGKIMIDGYLYDTSVNCDEYIGLYAEAYVRERDGDDEVIFVFPIDNDEIRLEPDDIVDISEDCTIIEYADESGRVKKLSVSEVATVIYNGQMLAAYDKDTLMPADGSIRLANNRDGNAYDIIYVTDYRTVIVNSISQISKTITNLYTYNKENITLNLEPDGEDIIRIYNEDGIETELENISVGDVLHIAESESEDKRIVKVYISKKKISDIVSEMRTADDYTYIKLGDTEYALSKTYSDAVAAGEAMAEQISVGATYTFSLDNRGRIVYASEDSGQAKFGLVLGCVTEGVFAEKCSIKLVTSEGQIKIYDMTEKINFNGDRTVCGNAAAKIPTAQDGTVSMIEYVLNRSGEITSVKLPEAYDGKNYNDFNTSGLNNLFYRGENRSFDADIFLDSNPTIWWVELDAQGNVTPDEEAYSVKGSGIYDKWSYNFYAYNLDEYRYTDMLVVLKAASSVLSEMEFAEVLVVDNVGETINTDGEAARLITGAMGKYESYSYHCDDSIEVYDKKASDAALISLNSLKRGDVVLIHADNKGTADRIELIYSADDERDFVNPDAIYAKDVIVRGKVEKVDAAKNRMRINCGGAVRTINAPSGLGVIIYDTERKLARSGTMADIEPEDYVITRLKWLKTSAIVVFR